MIRHLRQLAARPIAESERRAAFAIAVAIVLVAAVGLLASGGGSLPSPATSAAPDPARLSSPPAPRQNAPEAAAVRFLEGYLPFLYGQRGARSIRAATPRLTERLVRSRVRVPPAAPARRPRLEAIGVRGLADSHALVRARVGDGVVSYTIALALSRLEDRWLVVSVGAE